jgi:hypothetical protein
MDIFGSVVVAVVVLAAVLFAWRTHTSSRAYLRNRAVDYDRWRRLYPESQLAHVLDVLAGLCHSFLLRNDDVYRLKPSDRLRDIYHAAYPHAFADALEFEVLALFLEDSFQVPRDRCDQLYQATVGEVIAWTIEHKPTH